MYIFIAGVLAFYKQRIFHISKSFLFASSFQQSPYLIMRFLKTMNEYAQNALSKKSSVSCCFSVCVAEILYQDSDFEG